MSVKCSQPAQDIPTSQLAIDLGKVLHHHIICIRNLQNNKKLYAKAVSITLNLTNCFFVVLQKEP